MPYSEQLTQALALADYLNTQAVNNTNVQSAGMDMSKFRRALYIVRLDTAANGQVNCQLQSSATSNFSTAHNISTTLSNNLNTNNQLLTLEIRADQITNANSGDRYLRLYVATNANIQVSAVGLGGEAQQGPAGGNYNINSTLLGQQVVCSI